MALKGHKPFIPYKIKNQQMGSAGIIKLVGFVCLDLAFEMKFYFIGFFWGIHLDPKIKRS
jgi:hypothetical protein